MFNAFRISKTAANSGTAVAIVASLVFLLTQDQRAVELDAGEDAVLAVGLRLNQYGPVGDLPAWLTLPARSTAAYGRLAKAAGSNRVHFRSLLPTGLIEKHFRRTLLEVGFQVSVIHPPASRSGVASIISAFRPKAGQWVQITIRDGRTARPVEFTYVDDAAQVASKGVSVGS